MNLIVSATLRGEAYEQVKNNPYMIEARGVKSTKPGA